MYLRELRSYKPPTIKASDTASSVLKFKLPAAPRSPEETDLPNELKSYEAQQVEVEGQTAGGAPEQEYDWFEEDPEWEEYYKNEADAKAGKPVAH